MAKKVSKNSKVSKRIGNVGSGKDHVRVVKSVKNPITGAYAFREAIVHKEKVTEWYAAN